MFTDMVGCTALAIQCLMISAPRFEALVQKFLRTAVQLRRQVRHRREPEEIVREGQTVPRTAPCFAQKRAGFSYKDNQPES
jgi:hypothetical protein